MKKIDLGKVYMTVGITEAIKNKQFELNDVLNVIKRHESGDWGIISKDDKKLNDLSVKEGGRVVSSYIINNLKIYVITEANREYTTVLFPDEY